MVKCEERGGMERPREREEHTVNRKTDTARTSEDFE